MGDYTGGYTGAVNDGSRRAESESVMAMRALQARQLLMQMAEQQRAQQDRAQGGGVLEALMARMGVNRQPPQMGPPPAAGPNPMAPGGASVMAPPAMPQGGIAPPPAGTPAGGPMPPGVGVSSAPTQQLAPPPAAAAPMAAPPIPPFRALPSAQPPAYNAQGGLAPIPPPPGQGEAAPPTGEPEEREATGINLKSLVAGFRAAGIPKDRWMAQLELFTPLMNAENKMELARTQVQLKLAHDTAEFAHKRLQALMKEKEIGIRRDDVDSRIETRDRARDAADEANAIRRAKIGAGAGGTGNIAKWEYDDGDPPKVIGGWTRGGQHVKLDQPGRGTPRPAADAPGRDNARELSALLRERNSLVAEADPRRNATRLAELDKLIRERQAAPKPAAAPPAAAPKRISTPEEFNALPKGAQFIDARDGQTKIKG